MDILKKASFRLIGLALPGKTSNTNGQSNIDCGKLWQQFEKENWFARIPGKSSNEIFAVYHEYEGDHNAPFSYFIGCRVHQDTEVPVGMSSLTIPEGAYQMFLAKGKMPDCIANAWRLIWSADIQRAFIKDFEVYDERSQNWEQAEVDIFISV